MKSMLFFAFFIIFANAPVTITIEDHKIFKFCEGEFKRPQNGGPMVFESLDNYGKIIWCALERDEGFSFFCQALGVTQLQFKNFMLDFLVKRCSYGCRLSISLFSGVLEGGACVTSEKDIEGKTCEILRYLRSHCDIKERNITSEMSVVDMKKFKEFHFFDFAEVKDKEERDRLLARQNEHWRRIVENDFSHFSKFGKEMLPRLKNLYWIRNEPFEKYSKALKICLQEDAREMIELYFGVRFSPEFAGPAEPLEDILVPGIFEKVGIAATGVLESTQATAAAALDCVLSLFSKKPTSVVTVPEAQAFLGKKKQ